MNFNIYHINTLFSVPMQSIETRWTILVPRTEPRINTWIQGDVSDLNRHQLLECPLTSGVNKLASWWNDHLKKVEKFLFVYFESSILSVDYATCDFQVRCLFIQYHPEDG